MTWAAIGRTGVFRQVVLTTLALFAAQINGAEPATLSDTGLAAAGEWNGFIDRSVVETALIVRLEHSGDQWAGTMDVPEDNLSNVPLHEIVVDDDGISFFVKLQNNVLFTGKFVDKNQQINGQIKSGSHSFIFKLARAETLRASAPTAPPITVAEVRGLPSDRASLAQTDHPAIQYASRPLTDPIANLNRKIQAGTVELKYEDTDGYLRSVLNALKISSDTQMVVFSKTSVQAPLLISPSNPRALFFRDDVVVGFIHNAPFLEFAAQDPQQGVVFYILDQRDTTRPQFMRRDTCLSCHVTRNSMDVPGLLVRSVVTGSDGRAFDQLGSYHTDDRSPWNERWGGWYVTGSARSAKHMGNVMLTDPSRPELVIGSEPKALTSLTGLFETDAYPSPFSDIAALMVFEHQSHMSNLLIRLGWDARAALYQEALTGKGQDVTRRLLANDAREVVDYLLFVDEVPLSGDVRPSTSFAARFSSEGPYDHKGRTLRQLDLKQRLMQFPCSYMIYSAVFESLPSSAKDAVYERMWAVLSGKEKDARYKRLAPADRRTVIEILRDTKTDLPSYFK